MMAGMNFYLAMDAGGTKTTALVADETQVLARVQGASVKVMRQSEGEAEVRLGALLDEVATMAGVDLRNVSRSCVGLAGVSAAGAREWMMGALGRRVGGEIEIVGDEVVALDAAFEGGAGVLVMAGTGSNVIGRCADGKKFGAGGWGPVLGDEGSGYWIGLEAVRAALRAEDRGVPSCLLNEILGHWGLKELGELVGMANGRPSPDFAGLTPVVAKCAGGGDMLARGVLERAGTELGEQVSLVHSAMVGAGCDDAGLGVAFTGSVLEKISIVREAMLERVYAVVPQARVVAEAADPVMGALWRARSMR